MASHLLTGRQVVTILWTCLYAISKSVLTILHCCASDCFRDLSGFGSCSLVAHGATSNRGLTLAGATRRGPSTSSATDSNWVSFPVMVCLLPPHRCCQALSVHYNNTRRTRGGHPSSPWGKSPHWSTEHIQPIASLCSRQDRHVRAHIHSDDVTGLCEPRPLCLWCVIAPGGSWLSQND